MKDTTEPPSHGRFILSVSYSITQYPRRILVSPEETVGDLKAQVAPWVNAFVDEMDVFLRRDFPYPLNDEMCLGQLQEEHRFLFIHVRDPTCRTIPMRFISEEMDEEDEKDDGSRRILDLTALPTAWYGHVERWLHDDPLFHGIRLDGRRRETSDLLYMLGDMIRLLPCIRFIHVVADDGEFGEALAYIRYHIAMDQYRLYQVELLLDSE
jgi:hypothetical protein